MRVRVIGVGTRRGDDAAGLAVAAALAARPLPDGIEVRVCERPVPDLLDALEGAEAAVIVDAARTGAAPGSLRRLTRGELARAGSSSSHGLGVADALVLAASLGRAPGRIEILAIEASASEHETLSPRVAAALPQAARAALEVARELQGARARGVRDA